MITLPRQKILDFVTFHLHPRGDRRSNLPPRLAVTALAVASWSNYQFLSLAKSLLDPP